MLNRTHGFFKGYYYAVQIYMHSKPEKKILNKAKIIRYNLKEFYIP